MVKDRRLIVITGPTASGKSALAVELATLLKTEIISADSRQVYAGIPVSTAIPTEAERRGIPHHLMDFLPLDAYYSAALFSEQALEIARRLWDEGHRDVLVCGGSMMYVDTLCNGIDPLPTVPSHIREELQAQWDVNGSEWLRQEARRIDPHYCDHADMTNLKRLFHAIEITRTAGVPYSSLLTGKKYSRDFEILKICLELPREELFRRINRRCEEMVSNGLLEEARSVYDRKELNSLNTVGLKEMFKVLEGEWDMEFALARMAKNTRVYAKKQMTWFKREPENLFLAPRNVIQYIAGRS